MEYLTIKDAAEKWGISQRSVQQYCVDGRIYGAIKFAGTWAIPPTSQKPSPIRRGAQSDIAHQTKLPHGDFTQEKLTKNMHILMPLLNSPFEPGHCMEYIDTFEDADLKRIAECEYYYFSGQADRASAISEEYLDSDILGLKLSACWIYIYANLTLDRIENSHKAMKILQEMIRSVNENTPPQLKALSVFVSTAAAVLLHLPLKGEIPPLNQFISLLPPGLKLFALYVQAHYKYLQKEYSTSIGIVETALALEEDVYPIPSIYLHLVATMNYMSLKNVEKAKEHIRYAWALAYPGDLIQALGEHHGLLGGTLEAVIKKEFPEDFKRIIAITYKFSAGWRKVHNFLTGRSIADDLTTTEFAVSMLAARGWSNKEIAAHMGISGNTVKSFVATSLQKLNISQRKEPAQFMLH